MPLVPPPDGACFASWAECYQFVQTHAASEGFAVNSKGQAKSKDTGLYRRYVIRCDKSGRFKSSAQIGVRRISSKKTDCPFSAACNIRPDGCYLRVLVPDHNHPPSLPAAHTQHRKLTDAQRQLVETRAIERKSIKLIWNELKELDPDTLATFKDVDNAVQRFRKKAKDGATGVQAIMYKLVERQDLFCFTLEREGVVQGAFWVPRWSTDLWMRPNGTPDILVMLSEHIANRPVLPILEMNSVLNTAGFGIAPPSRALPNDPVNPNINPDLIPNPNIAPSADDLATDDNNNSNSGSRDSEGPMLNPTSMATTAQNVSNDAGRSNYGFDSSLGAGYAILPDKTDTTMLWLRSAVEMLRQRIPQCPKPRFLTLTDFQTAEKNVLLEISKGGAQHRQMHIVFGRVLTNDEGDLAHHGAKTRKPRVEMGHIRDADATTGLDDEIEDDDEDEEQQRDVDDEQEGDIEEDDDDHDMDGDHDSDAEIARQLTAGNTHPHNNPSDNHHDHDRHNDYNNPNQPSFNLNPQQHLDHPQSHNHGSLIGRLPLPPRATRHPAIPAQPQVQPSYSTMNAPMMAGRMPPNMVPGHQRRQ
ncbi:hypothetical protein F4782DRAFT_284302 [Xylaria castorea]|nr:hypothetical protein F4782DRAFT_284302 [Xylaria castorea]